MNEDSEFQRAKWLIGAAGIFLISAFMSFDEFRYKFWGKTVEGRIVRVKETSTGGRHSRRPMLSVEYSFPDQSGRSVVESDLVAIDSAVSVGGGLPIQFIPGSPYSSRILGHSNTVWVYVFFGSLAVMILFIVKLAREANEPPVRRRRRRP